MQKLIFKTRRKLILSITLIVLGALCIFAFAACSDDVTDDVFKKLGYKVSVTYDFQGGTSNKRPDARILIKPNSKLPAPSRKSGLPVPTRTGYSFKGYYLPETDEDGNVKKDEDGNVIVSDTAWDFNNDTITDKDMTLYAKWWDNYKVVLHYGSEYKEKQEISLPRNQDGSPTKLTASSLKVDNYTFLSYNLTEGSEDPATELKDFPYEWSSTAFANSDTVNIWGKSLDGIYTLVRSKDDFNIAVVEETKNYYLLADIDMGGAEYDDEGAQNRIPKSYSGKFIGNNYTISNFKLTMRVIDPSYDSFGLFRSLKKGAEISGVTFKDISLSYNLSNANVSNYYIGMLAGQCEEGVVVKNVNFTSSKQDGNTLEYEIGIGVDNSKLNVAKDLLIAQKPGTVVLEDCSATNVKRVYSAAVTTDDKEFTLYVKYTEDDGVITLLDNVNAIYGLTQKNDDGDYDEKRIKAKEFIGKNKYELTRLHDVYSIEFTISDDTISATMVWLRKEE